MYEPVNGTTHHHSSTGVCYCDQCVQSNGVPGTRFVPKYGALANSSLLWRSRSFAGGLQANALPVTSTPADGRTRLTNGDSCVNNSLAPHCSSSLNSSQSSEQATEGRTSTELNASNRYSVQMRHSTSDHSYLSAKADATSSMLPTSMRPLDASSLSSVASSASGSLSRNSTLITANRYSSLGNLNSKSLFSGLATNGKNLRTPTPERSLSLFLAIEKGLRECIALTQNDIVQLKTSIEDGLSFGSAQQCKTAERYLKRLEFQLAKVEELRDQYEMHIKMSQGVNSMVYAYGLVPGKEKELAMNSARSELRECMQQMVQLEQHLQGVLGTLRLQMQGIQGFARLCAGDQFEISIRCGGRQKWKCRGKILKDNVQSWDCTEQLFRLTLNEPLTIKAVEVKGIAKKVCLGEKQCELAHLMAARPQLMTICLNVTGTLKLHLIATWNPLHVTAENGKASIGLSKSKSFLGSSSSLLSRLTGGNSHTGTLSHNYSGLSKSMSSYNLGSGMNGTLPLDGTLRTSTLSPRHIEILDADYFYHPHLFAGSETGARLARQSSALSERSRPMRPHSYHPAGGFLTPIPSPAPEESPRALSPADLSVEETAPASTSEATVPSTSSGVHSAKVTEEPPLANTPSSSGSRGSLIHLTGTSSSGFGSSSSYCGSSMPNSTLTSPDCESPPASQMRSNAYNNNQPKAKQIVVQVQVHADPSTSPTQPIAPAVVPRSTSMPVALSDQTQAVAKSHTSSLERSGTCSVISEPPPSVPSSSQSPPAQLFFNVTDTLVNLMSSLEDIQGQYTEIYSLHQHVLDLYKLLTQMSKLRSAHFSLGQIGRVRRKSDASEYSLSVERALECFDFLNAVTDSDSSPEHEAKNSTRSKPTPPRRTSSMRGDKDLSSNTKDSTSGNNTPVKSPSPQESNDLDTSQPPTDSGGTGSEQLDIALMSHLTYCQRLLENLGAFGPLRCRERHSLEKLRTQSQPLSALVRLCVNVRDHLQFTLQLRQEQVNSGNNTTKLESQLRAAHVRLQAAQKAELCAHAATDARVQRLWQLVCAMHAQPAAFGGQPNCMNITSQPFDGQLLCVTSAGFVWALCEFARVHALRSGSTFQPPLSWLADDGQRLRSTCELITQRLLDAPSFESDYVVSILQVRVYLAEEGASVEHLFRAHAQEAQLLHVLRSADVLSIKGALHKFKRTLPPREPLLALALLLLHSDQLLVHVVQQHFIQAMTNKSLRGAMLEQFVEALENDQPAVRQAACCVLSLLNAQECLEQLAFVCCADTEGEVRAQARQTLLSAGARGRQLYEESQLFSNGFQGLTVK